MRITIYCCFLVICFSNTILCQQTVFPGDANANGKVDQYDIPYIGYAFNSTGPARIQTESSLPQGIAGFWETEFPFGLNYIHSDCDGDGVVAFSDFIYWNNNYGWEDALVSDIPLSEFTVDNTNEIIWNDGFMPVPVTGNTQLSIPLEFVFPLTQDVNGIAFKIRYQPNHFSFANYSNQESWLTLDGNGVSFHRGEPGVVDVGVTRFGNMPMNGGGVAGTMNLIVIGDMVDLLETPTDTLSTYLFLEDILIVDGDFQTIPISSDSLEIKLFRANASTNIPNVINTLQAQVFPNPSNGSFQLNSELPFTDLVLYNALGQPIHQEYSSARQTWSPQELQLAPGYYHIELQDASQADHRSVLRLLIQ